MSPLRSTGGPLDLLGRLGSGVRPDGVGASGAAQGARGLESASFDELLALAREGKVEAGAPLTFAKDVSRDLGTDTLDALALATDAAEAQGATRLAAQIDGRVVTIDVNRREILGVEPARPNAVFTGVDAFVALAPTGAASEEGGAGGARLALPGSLPANGALSRLMEHRAG